MAEILPAIANRRATRAFAETPVDDGLKRLLWTAVRVAPSHGNTQPVRILVAESPAVREAFIAALSEGNQSWAAKAPLLAALAVNPSHENTKRYGDERALHALHLGIALGNLMAQATALGLVAHPLAGFDEDALRTAFEAPGELRVLVALAIGHPGDPETLPEDLRAREARPQERLTLEQIVVTNRWAPEHGIAARERRKTRS